MLIFFLPLVFTPSSTVYYSSLIIFFVYPTVISFYPTSPPPCELSWKPFSGCWYWIVICCSEETFEGSGGIDEEGEVSFAGVGDERGYLGQTILGVRCAACDCFDYCNVFCQN